ncbi:hypothetical protein KL86CLO1_13419 [uncultured Eubacteriales bacterium]|uniref:Uncharacterized protein n=1 Tax=uncultured Eubacteriales bacterium TaxID=172733 RepID=A0A212KJP3_9FIRM|nr:hypothetical protein KL86CLO1_13419 [uncultured Eubacteriales bacterium]
MPKRSLKTVISQEKGVRTICMIAAMKLASEYVIRGFQGKAVAVRSGDGVVLNGLLAVEGLTFQNPLEREPAALCCAVLLHRLQRIGRTGGDKAAGGWSQRGNIPAVPSDEEQKELFHALFSGSAKRPSLSAV